MAVSNKPTGNQGHRQFGEGVLVGTFAATCAVTASYFIWIDQATAVKVGSIGTVVMLIVMLIDMTMRNRV